jgi:hypothetical protein
MSDEAKDKASSSLDISDWARELEAQAWLTPGLRESYRRIIGGFLEFCRQRKDKPSVTLARETQGKGRRRKAEGGSKKSEGPTDRNPKEIRNSRAEGRRAG